MKVRHIYCDMDGVLANFDKAATELFGTSTYFRDWDREARWDKINSRPNFYLDLEPMPDAYELWEYLMKMPSRVTILTALARRVPTCASEKLQWMWFSFKWAPHNTICVYEDKWPWAFKGDILIDDFPKNIDAWRIHGGIGILHKSAAQTILELDEHLA